MNRVLLLFACAISFAVGPAAAEEVAGGKPAKTVRLLTVGNSFSQNATRYLGDLAQADGNTLVHHACSIGGGTMAQHLEKV